MAKLSPNLETEVRFRKCLAAGKPVALEDATQAVDYPEGFDKRSLGWITRGMSRDGEIIEAGFRRGVSSSCNQAPKRLWVAVDPSTIYRRESRA